MQTETHTSPHHEIVSELIMSMMGVDRFAYIKPLESFGQIEYAVYAADGTQLANFESIEEAFSSILEYNLTPVNIH